MQWNQPGPADRPRVLVFAAAGAVLGYGVAFGLIAVVVRATPAYEGEVVLSALNRVAIGCMAIICIGLATLCADMFWKVRRAPSTRTRRVLRSEDGTLLVALLAIALASLAFTTGGVDALRHGRTEAPVLGVIVVIAVGLLGGVCLLGSVAVAWKALRLGPSTLTLEGARVTAGSPVTAVLEIPFASSKAPRSRVDVILTRWEAPVSCDDASSGSTVWRESVDVEEWASRGRGRAAARLTCRIPAEPPADIRNPRISYVWSLRVDALDGVVWNAQFTLPIEFVEDPARAA
ncbi:MAG: hypothetical protein R3195_12880 [Gemmatimonadota bacterium]|nr:hypothetical protein [Gemmatimonadota bacterium]